MASERASDPTCTCPSGDGSLRWPCPKHPPAAAPAEMSPELTDTARAAIAWVLWHHQGASSPVGQPLRFALGMGADEPLPDWRIAEAKRYAAWAGATTAKFHEARAITPAAPGIDLVSDILTDLSNVAGSWVVEAAGASADAQNDCAMQMHEAIERWSNKLHLGDASTKGVTFRNYGDSEAQFIADGERLNCPACGGSGHIDDSPKGGAHPDDLAVDAFAAAMKAKLADARAKGRGGWNGDEPGMHQRLSDLLRAHVEKGDPRDVSNFCMFLHQRGEGISAPAPIPRPMDTAPRDGTLVRLLVQFEEHLIEDTDEPAWTIGACNDDLVPDDERTGWQIAGWCWEHDHFTEGKGTPVGWLPMLDSPKDGSDTARLDSGMIRLSHRDEFGEDGYILHTGVNLRAAIDAAMQAQAGDAEVPHG